MVAPIRELVNILFPVFTKAFLTSSITQNPSNMDMDVNINTYRGRFVFSSNKSSRKSSIHSNASSILYFKKMEIQSDNTLWSKQIE